MPTSRPGRTPAILSVHTRNRAPPSTDLDALAADTEGFVGADLAGLCRDPPMAAARRFMGRVHTLQTPTLNILKSREPTCTAALAAMGHA